MKNCYVVLCKSVDQEVAALMSTRQMNPIGSRDLYSTYSIQSCIIDTNQYNTCILLTFLDIVKHNLCPQLINYNIETHWNHRIIYFPKQGHFRWFSNRGRRTHRNHHSLSLIWIPADGAATTFDNLRLSSFTFRPFHSNFTRLYSHSPTNYSRLTNAKS